MKLTTLKSTLRRMGEARMIRAIQDGEYRGCFEVIPREEDLLSRGDSDNGCVSESLNLLHPVNLCIGESLCEPDSAIQTDSKACIRDESSNTNGLEHDRFKDSKDAIVDPNRCIGEEGRFKTDSPSEELNPVLLPRVESEPAYDPFAVLGL